MQIFPGKAFLPGEKCLDDIVGLTAGKGAERVDQHTARLQQGGNTVEDIQL